MQVREPGGDVRTYANVFTKPERAARDEGQATLFEPVPEVVEHPRTDAEKGDKREIGEREQIDVPFNRGQVQVSGDRRRMARWWAGGRVVVDDLESGRRVREIAVGTDSLSQLVFSADGSLLLIGEGPTASVWDTESGRRVYEWVGDTTHFRTFIFTPDNSAVIGLAASEMSCWDLKTGKMAARCRMPENSSKWRGGFSLPPRFSYDSNYLLLADRAAWNYSENRASRQPPLRISVVWRWRSGKAPTVIRWARSGYLAPTKKRFQSYSHWGLRYSQSWRHRGNQANRRGIQWGIGPDETNTAVTVGDTLVAWYPDALTFSTAISRSQRKCAGERVFEQWGDNRHLLMLSLEGAIPEQHQRPTNRD